MEIKMKKWSFYTSKEIKPEGWMKRQLEIQAEGLSGNLDKVWRDVRDSAWIGGEAEGWERVPYWLDGFIPLAYLLENEDMIGRAKKYIDAIISFQKPDGWICPCAEDVIPRYDTWAVQLISKVLVVYYECSGDERIPDVLYRVMKNYYDLLKAETVKLFSWGKFRWFEAFIAIEFLQKRYNEPWLVELAEILKAQGLDYNTLVDRWKTPLSDWTLETHIVNLVMMLKHEAMSGMVLGGEYTDNAEKLVTILDKYNGTPVGLFTGDECLSGLSAIQGTELCAVVEQMYSYEHLFAYTGDSKWAERLELIAFNALPATLSDDMWAHQYVQMSNQNTCEQFPSKAIFGTNKPESHLFGLEPNYGCCTSNFNQGWPKLTIASFMHDGDSILSVVPVPATLNDEKATIALTTEYPFKNKLCYEIEAKQAFTFKVRVPSFAKNLTVNGEKCRWTEELSFDLKAGEKKTVEVSFDVTPVMVDRPHDLKTFRAGSLVFALPIAYEKKMQEYTYGGVERKFPYCDYEYAPMPGTSFNYGYSSCFIDVSEREVSDIPFSSEKPPVVAKALVKKISWGYEPFYEKLCAKVPESRTPISEEEEIELYPYGCAKLRMTELPLV